MYEAISGRNDVASRNVTSRWRHNHCLAVISCCGKQLFVDVNDYASNDLNTALAGNVAILYSILTKFVG